MSTVIYNFQLECQLVLSGLFYDGIGNVNSSEMALKWPECGWQFTDILPSITTSTVIYNFQLECQLVFSGLFYDGIGNEIGAEMALMEANKLNVAEAAEAQRLALEEERRDKAEAAALAAAGAAGEEEAAEELKAPGHEGDDPQGEESSRGVEGAELLCNTGFTEKDYDSGNIANIETTFCFLFWERVWFHSITRIFLIGHHLVLQVKVG